MRIVGTRPFFVGLLAGFAALGTGCVSEDPPEASAPNASPSIAASLAASGGAWATQADAACAETKEFSAKRPTGSADGVAVLTWHQQLAFTLATRVQSLPDAPVEGTELGVTLHELGAATENLVTELQAEPVDDAKRQAADAARSAAIGKAAALSAQLGLAGCTPLIAGAG